MSLFANFLGRLGWDAFPHDAVTRGGAISMVLIGLGLLAFISYKKRWGWLWRNWFTSLDPKKIGVMYIVVALVMLVRGIADAAMMRGQQALSSGDSHGFLDPNHFQQVFSAHGTIMIFFAAMGLMFGIINLILPLQIGSRDVAFPWMNSVSFWLFASGMLLVNLSLLLGEFSAAGWLAYPPLSEIAYSPGVGVDYWIWALQIAGVGSLLSGINFIVTILKLRAPGMTLMKMPIFAWSVLGSMSLVAFAFPILTATLGMLALDRTFGMHFFTADAGGNAMMYINLIWAWGHPEVYILILPAFGIFSELVPVFARKKLFGYTSMVWAIWGIVLLSFTVWLHHFFTMGAGANVNAFFGIMTGVIAIPTGVKVFNWLFTMWRGKIHFATPMLWFMAFIACFTLGGITGVLMSIPPADFQFHNSLFLVAHFHTMIVSGVLFGFFAGLTYWFPKMFGFRLHEGLGKCAFWFWTIGFLLAFIPLYILGIMGATRRLDHYDASMGWQGLFIVAALGVGLILVGIGFQILQLVYSIWRRNKTAEGANDPWDGRTLEWSTPSPAPEYNFAILPAVAERDAYWVQKQSGERSTPHYEDIRISKNSGAGIVLAGFAFLFGFAVVWHIAWLAVVGIIGVITTLIIRLSNDDIEETLRADEIEKLEHKHARERRYA